MLADFMTPQACELIWGMYYHRDPLKPEEVWYELSAIE